MTPNGPDRIQGIGPDVDAKAIKKAVEEALTEIFKKHKYKRYEQNNNNRRAKTHSLKNKKKGFKRSS